LLKGAVKTPLELGEDFSKNFSLPGKLQNNKDFRRQRGNI
jgi:hypothetical protein